MGLRGLEVNAGWLYQAGFPSARLGGTLLDTTMRVQRCWSVIHGLLSCPAP